MEAQFFNIRGQQEMLCKAVTRNVSSVEGDCSALWVSHNACDTGAVPQHFWDFHVYRKKKIFFCLKWRTNCYKVILWKLLEAQCVGLGAGVWSQEGRIWPLPMKIMFFILLWHVACGIFLMLDEKCIHAEYFCHYIAVNQWQTITDRFRQTGVASGVFLRQTKWLTYLQ